ncbi:uncharacterized protein LOC143281594 [Babylonia areolata]|uniref:uncharacterized protein LOC143281594 n=1 Tax=Babylonia areolata TaxID=304850 RepID=UPI003FD33D5E
MMDGSQTEQGDRQQSEDQSAGSQAVDKQETEAIQVAKSELHKTMAEVADNPPTEQPPPPSVLAHDINYEEPMPDPYNKAINYLEQHNILQIFQSMTASIIFQKPENPLDFMISEIAEMKKTRDSKSSTKK